MKNCENCENCKFWSQLNTNRGNCFRFPKEIETRSNYKCGEFQDKNPRQLLNESITYSEYPEL